MHRNYATLCAERPVATTAALGAWLYVWMVGIYLATGLFSWSAPTLPHEYIVFGGTLATDLIVLHASYGLLLLLGAIAFNDYADFIISVFESPSDAV